MTRNDTEIGIIKLPTAEFAKVRKAVEDALVKEGQKTFDDAQALWARMTPKQKSSKDIDGVLSELTKVVKRVNNNSYGMFGGGRSQVFEQVSYPDNYDQLSELFDRARSEDGTIKRPKKTDLDLPTSRTMEFSGSACYINFDRDGSTVM